MNLKELKLRQLEQFVIDARRFNGELHSFPDYELRYAIAILDQDRFFSTIINKILAGGAEYEKKILGEFKSYFYPWNYSISSINAAKVRIGCFINSCLIISNRIIMLDFVDFIFNKYIVRTVLFYKDDLQKKIVNVSSPEKVLGNDFGKFLFQQDITNFSEVQNFNLEHENRLDCLLVDKNIIIEFKYCSDYNKLTEISKKACEQIKEYRGANLSLKNHLLYVLIYINDDNLNDAHISFKNVNDYNSEIKIFPLIISEQNSASKISKYNEIQF